jgi:hypothetical protein
VGGSGDMETQDMARLVAAVLSCFCLRS